MTSQEPSVSDLTPFDDEIDHFDHVPQLVELVQHGGTPGYVYAQVCSHNLHRGRREGWSLVNRDAYVIEGTKGHADMILMVKGEANTLLSPLSGMRKCYIDKEVGTLTGLLVDKSQEIETKPTPQVAKPKSVVDDIRIGPAAKG